MKTLKIMILFVIVLSGCSHKYVNVEGKSLNEKVIASWEELDCKIVEQDEQSFSLGLQLRNIIVVGDSVKSGKLNKHSSLEKKDFWPLLGAVIGFSGCLGGIYYVRSQDYDILPAEEQLEAGCFISGISCLTGFAMILGGSRKGDGSINIMPDFIKTDTICVDSRMLSKGKIAILVENSNFEKTYYADENGNVELGFDYLIPGPTEADSVINLIIQYESLVDTVKVRRL